MNDYCVVPPYVIQDVPPNVMMILDNSGSMFNLAYACTTTNATSSGTNTTVIPVKDVSGFSQGNGLPQVRDNPTANKR